SLTAVRIEEIAVGVGFIIRAVNISITKRQLQVGRDLPTPFGNGVLLGLLYGSFDSTDGFRVALRNNGRNTILGISAIDGIRLPAMQIGKTARYNYFCRVHIFRHVLVLLLKIRFCG